MSQLQQYVLGLKDNFASVAHGTLDFSLPTFEKFRAMVFGEFPFTTLTGVNTSIQTLRCVIMLAAFACFESLSAINLACKSYCEQELVEMDEDSEGQQNTFALPEDDLQAMAATCDRFSTWWPTNAFQSKIELRAKKTCYSKKSGEAIVRMKPVQVLSFSCIALAWVRVRTASGWVEKAACSDEWLNMKEEKVTIHSAVTRMVFMVDNIKTSGVDLEGTEHFVKSISGKFVSSARKACALVFQTPLAHPSSGSWPI